MSEKPEALRLADELDAFNPFSGALLQPWLAAAATELRRLHAENEVLTANRDELGWMVQRLAVSEALLEAKNKRLREALEIIAGCRQCVDPLMGNQDVAKAALRREDKT